MDTRTIGDTLKQSNKSTNSEGKNRIDGINTHRGEGLPYREDSIQSYFAPKPFTSKILAATHPDGENKIGGYNEHRGEGLPYQEIHVTDNNIELPRVYEKKF
jgi:hypothetical protein